MLEYTPDRRLTGGLRLPAHKDASTAGPIARGLVPDRVILPLAPQGSMSLAPVVSVGDRVLRGQVVATAASFAAAAHASTSGIVQSIEPQRVPTPTGVAVVPCVIVAADGRHESVDFAAAPPWPADRSAQLERIRAAGIVGLGGAAYPTAAKLAAASACRVLIVNGAECEPYISCDDMLMRESAEQIVAGTLIMGELLGAERYIIAIERDKPLAIDAIGQAAVAAASDRLRLAELPSLYPAGGERQLIEVLTGEEVPAGTYPSALGYACQNVGTAFAVQRLKALGEPLLTRIVTVAGNGIGTARNVEVPIGTPIAALVAHCGGYRGEVRRLVHGGSMMGYALPSDALPVTKGTNCIIAAGPGEVRENYDEWPCIRCGECGSACPVRLQPQDLLIAARADDDGTLDALGLVECIECGCCDVICPSHIALTEIFRQAKSAQRARGREHELAALSERRHLAREERRRLEAELVRHQRDQLMHEVQSPETGKSAVTAAVERARRKRQRPDVD